MGRGVDQLPLLVQIVYSLVKLMVGESWAGKCELMCKRRGCMATLYSPEHGVENK